MRPALNEERDDVYIVIILYKHQNILLHNKSTYLVWCSIGKTSSSSF